MLTDFNFSSDNLSRPNPNKCAPAAITVSPVRLAFSLVLDGTRTKPQEITVTNTGKGVIGIEQALITAGSKDFSILNPGAVPSNLAAGQSFKLVVDFAAAFDGQAVGVLQIFTDEDRLPYSVALFSQTEKQGGLRDLYDDLAQKLAKEIIDRADGDQAVLDWVAAKLKALEQATGSDKEQVAQNLSALEARLKAYSDAAVAAVRKDFLVGDAALKALIDAITTRIDNGNIPGLDQGARDLIKTEITNRETAFEIEKGIREQLKADLESALGNASAAITEEINVRVNQYEAIATKVTTIEASYAAKDDVETIASALIKVEMTAYASQIEAFAKVVETLDATIENKTGLAVEAKMVTEREARVTGDEAVVKDIVERLVSYATNESVSTAISNNNTTLKADIDGAYVTKTALTDLKYVNATDVSTIVDQAVEDYAATADGAFVTKTYLTELGYISGTNAGTLIDQKIASYKTDAEGTFATKTEIVNAKYVTEGTLSTAVTTKIEEYMTNASGSWVTKSELTELKYQTDTQVSTAIGNAITAFGADPNGSFATSIRSLETRLNGGDGVSIEEKIKSATDAAGKALASYSLEINADQNGRKYVTGVKYDFDGSRTDMLFTTDTFRIMIPGAEPKQVFFADQNGVYMPDVRIDRLTVGAVKGENLSEGAVQRSIGMETVGDIYIGKGQSVEVCYMDFEKQDDDSILRLMFNADIFSGDDFQLNITFLVDGVPRRTSRTNMVFVGDNASLPFAPFALVRGVPKGGHRVAITIENAERDNVNVVVYGGALFEVVELRKGSIGQATNSGQAFAY